MDKVGVICIFSSYVLAALFALVKVRRGGSAAHWLMFAASGAGLLAHTIYLLDRARDANLPPLLVSSHDWLLVTAYIAVSLFLFLTTLDRELPLGVFVLPAVLALVVASQFVSIEPNALVSDAEQLRTARRGWVLLHTSMLVFGVVGVIGSLILALMYLVQHRRLKQRQGLTAGVHLPSLARLERWNRRAVVLSVPLLTLGMAAGVLLGLMTGTSQPVFSDPIVIASGLGWLAMLCLFVWLLRPHHAPARQVALLTVWACGFLLLTVVGLQVVTGTGHSPTAAVKDAAA